MKIVKLKGGLGNQMFQYAFAYLLKQTTGEDVKLDMSSFSSALDDPIRQPRILKLSLSLPAAAPDELRRACLLRHEGALMSFPYRLGILLESILNRGYFLEKDRGYIEPGSILRHRYFDGYWQSWRYVEPVWAVLREEFTPSVQLSGATQETIRRVSEENSVFLGVRKGDYSSEASHYGCFGNDYFRRAMDLVSERVKDPVFYVFSNDIPWVMQNIDFTGRSVRFRTPELIVDDFEEFMIMAACRHSIIINSTFHWWGARMNDAPGKTVVAPKKWFFDDKPIDIIPPHWIRIDA